MGDIVNQEEWTGVYYSMGLGKFFTVDVKENAVFLKEAFTGCIDRELEYGYFNYFVNNSEFIAVDENVEKHIYDKYRKKCIQNQKTIEENLSKIKSERKKLERKYSRLKSERQLYKKKSNVETDDSEKWTEKYEDVTDKYEYVAKNLKLIKEKEQKIIRLYNKINQLK